MKKFNIIFAFLLLLISNKEFAQNSCDVIVTSIRINDGIIISAISDSNSTVLSKIDPQGNELWKINESGTPTNGIKLFSDGFVYILNSVSSSLPTGNNIKLVKINPANGQVVWRSTIIGSDSDISNDFLEFDSNNVFLCSGIEDRNGGTAAGFQTYLIQKSNGVSQLNSKSNRFCSSLKIAKDSKNNIIYATNNISDSNTNLLLTKVNGYNLKNVLWQKSYNNSITSATLSNINKLFLDNLDNIYAFSSGDNIDAFKIESLTGNELWSKNNIASERVISDYKLRNNSLYISFQHIYVGSVYTAFEIVKIDTSNGSVSWSSISEHMSFTGATIPQTTGKNESVSSFDIDCNGNVFATGYYGSSNYSPGAWGIMKINGNTGVKINDLTITNNSAVLNTLSHGKFAYVFNDGVVFLGNLQYKSTNAARVCVKTNFQLSSNYSKKYSCYLDSDGDSIQDYSEDVNGNGFIENDDSDNDGILNYLDSDDDNDGVLTINEDSNRNNNPLDDFSDPTNPNLPNYLNKLITLGQSDYFEDKLRIYPYPTKGIINIELSQNISLIKIELFSVNGVKLIEKNENLGNIDISSVSKGLYILKITSDLGVYNSKIIKE